MLQVIGVYHLPEGLATILDFLAKQDLEGKRVALEYWPQRKKKVYELSPDSQMEMFWKTVYDEIIRKGGTPVPVESIRLARERVGLVQKMRKIGFSSDGSYIKSAQLKNDIEYDIRELDKRASIKFVTRSIRRRDDFLIVGAQHALHARIALGNKGIIHTTFAIPGGKKGFRSFLGKFYPYRNEREKLNAMFERVRRVKPRTKRK